MRACNREGRGLFRLYELLKDLDLKDIEFWVFLDNHLGVLSESI